ncbi:MAG TPA: 3-oxoacyl-ACP reductase FabG [Clostridia bacterium]|nr:3-oxoacyl-ACP reductase FabG [Clostridia bacterium]
MRKTVLITGAAGGIGSRTAKVFAKNGYNVILNYNKSREQAKALAREISSYGIEAIAVCADIRDITQVQKMVYEALEKFSFIDVLVNNAGISQQKLFTEISQDEYDEMFDVNVKGTFNCCQKVLPSMISRQMGKIINVSSVWGVCGGSCEVHYSAAKAAVIGMTKALAKEVGPSNIQVNAVTPGVIETKMNDNIDKETMKCLAQSVPLCRTGKPDEVAQLIYFLGSENSNFITGQIVGVDGGMGI